MNAVITGSTGLIGSELALQLLNAGHTVTALSRSPKSVEKLSYTLLRGGKSIDDLRVEIIDMFDFEALKEAVSHADVVFHTAAVVDLSGRDIIAENVELTELVVEACLQSATRPILVHISSIAALPETISNLTESSPYAQSKFLSENQIWRASKLGLRVGVVAPAVVLGVGAPGSSGLQPVITRAQKGLPFYTNGETGFVDVRDVAAAMIVVAQNPQLQGKRYVLCSENMNYRDFVGRICVAAGRRKPFFRVDPWMFKIVTRLLGLFCSKPLLTNEMAGFLFSRNRYDGTPLAMDANKAFHYHTIDETIADIIRKS